MLGFDKAKVLMQVTKLKKEIEGLSVAMDEQGVEVEVGGFMTMGEPKIKKLVVGGVEDKRLVEVLNRALKKAAEASMNRMKEKGSELGNGFGG